MAATARVDLLGVELQRAGVGQQLLAQLAGAVELADLAQRRDQPERADGERALLPAHPIVRLFGAVAQHHAVDGQLVGDCEHRGADARVVGRKEANQRDQEHRRVQRLAAVVLDEHPSLVDAALADVGLDLVGDTLPRPGELGIAVHLRQPRPAVQRDPAHELGGSEVLRLAAHLPETLVGHLPVLDRALHGALEDRPDDLGQVVARLRVQVDRIEHRPPHVVLLLVVRGVADPDGPRALIPAQVVECLLDELVLAADAVHDLQLLLARGDVGDEVEEVVGLAREPERVQAPQHESAVADPRVAVVPVALAADRLRERRRRRGQERPRRTVGQPLQRQRAALQVALPRMLGELAAVDPLPPEVGGLLDPVERLLDGGRRRVLGPVLLAGRVPRARPDHRHVRPVARAQRLGRVRARTLEAHPHVRDEAEGDLVLASARDGLVVAGAVVLPLGVGLPVVEDGLAVQGQLDLADHAPRRAEKDVLRLVVGRRPAVGARAALAVVPGPDAHGVAHDQPARARPPRGLQDEGPGQVAPAGRDLDAGRTEGEAPGRAVEDGGENAGAVGAGNAHPLDPSGRRDQAVDLAVGQERVLGDGRERAGDARLGDLWPDLDHGRLAVAVDGCRHGPA